MRHKTAQMWRISGTLTLIAAMALGAGSVAHAQLPVFDSVDWITDRGSFNTVGVVGVPAGGVNADAFRPGYNGFLITDPPGGPPSSVSPKNNNPGPGARRWVFPRTSDLIVNPTVTTPTVVVDNGTRTYLQPPGNYAVPPAPFADEPDFPNGAYVRDSAGNRVRALPLPPGVFADGSYNPQLLAHMRYATFGSVNWTLPDVVPFAAGDYRSEGGLGGYSINSDPSLPWDYDYAFTPAVFNQFLINRADGTVSPATSAEIAQLPYGSQDVVSSINFTLNGTPQLRAFYSMGGYNTAPGGYAVDVWMPGDGTIIGNTAHPSISRAFVRVSWGTSAVDGVNNTVNADGTFNLGTVQNLVNSRIFLVDMEGAGWYTLAAPGQVETSVPYDGTPADQITVEVYTITPDSVNPGDPNSQYGQTPLITADAVRFRPVALTTSGGLGLGTISADGKILAPAAGTSKFNNANSPNVQPTELLPFVYIGREEIVQDFSVLVPENPLLPVDPNQFLPSPPALPDTPNPNYNPLVPDPTATKTVPVFYCIDNQNGNALLGGAQITSIDKVRWRYEGLPDSNDLLIDGSNTTVSAPLIANVRCRDGAIRPMVYFTQTNADDSLGRIYAFDPVGDRTQLTTNLYWVYPSFRPITAADINTNAQFAAAFYEYHDPNYKNTFAAGGAFGLQYDPGTYPVTSFGNPAIADQAIGADFYYDGQVSPNIASPGTWQVTPNNTQIPVIGGVTASPLLIDDPANPSGPQLLIVPSQNGRVYAFDAGGRGDFSPISGANPLPGTTQRLWTYPHFGADAYNFLGKSKNVAPPNLPPSNIILDDNSKISFSQTAAYDPNYINGNPNGDPFFLPAQDGYYYAINPIRDAIGNPPVFGSQHANWNDGARLNWQYPAFGATPLLNPQTGACDSSPITLFTSSANAKFIYFTSLGHVYCLPEFTNTTANVPNWIFPFTPNPPYANATDTFFYSFNGMPPLAITKGNLPGSTQDELYVLDNTSTISMLDPFGAGGGGTTTLQAAGQTVTGANTSSAPIMSLLQTQQQWSVTGTLGTTSLPALVFGDGQGSVWGLEANPEIINGLPTQAVVWSQFDSFQSRDANVVLANGMLLSGSEDGQLRAYGVGSGPNEDLDTLGTGEPAQHTPGVGTLSIDLRTLNVYTPSDWNSMELGPTAAPPTPPGARRTPLRDENGNALTNSANPLAANVTSTNIIAVDWGDYLYVAAAGVYHAQPQDPSQVVFGTTIPQINVTFNLTQPGVSGGASVTYPLGSAQGLFAPGYAPGQGQTPTFWPDDLGVTGGEHNNLKIYGLDSSDGTFKTLTGSANNVYPWIAKLKIPINPSGLTPFSPGTTGYKLTAVATIQQTVTNAGQSSTAVNTSNYLDIGQPNWTGFDLTPGAGGSIVIPNPSRLPAGRTIGVTNPIGLTVRNYFGNGGVDMTGSNNPNVIGWFGSVLQGPKNIGELLGQGNNQAIPGLVAAGATSPFKDLFAPIGILDPGSTKLYQAIDNNSNPTNALYVVDRTALGRMTGNKSFQIQVLAAAPHWFGGGSSVMNPLPWEVMPVSNSITTSGSADYPGLSTNSLSMVTANGQDALRQLVTLNSPYYNDTNPIQNPATGDPIQTRLNNPTPINMSVSVPQYQPANVNRGVTAAKLWDGTVFNFGQGLTGISGTTHGLNVANDPIIGPMQSTNGVPVAPGNARAFPAGGYVSSVTVNAIPPSTGVNGGTSVMNSRLALVLGRSGNTASAGLAQEAYREFTIGLSVAPSIKLRTIETTVDLGKQPEGAGMSDIVSGFFRIPFAPTGSINYPLAPNGFNSYAPWDDPYSTSLTKMFQSFDLVSESNVNLINIRAAKMEATLAQPQILPGSRSAFANLNQGALALKLGSDLVNNLSISPLSAAAFFGPASGVGNIGLVTSFDHISQNVTPVPANPNFTEHALWPIPNPYSFTQDIQAVSAVNSSLISTNSLNKGVFGWFGTIQPQPTIGKPRVGDTIGHTATIPDKPHDAPDVPAFIEDPSGIIPGPVTPAGSTYVSTSFFTSPKIGIAIPMGTPVGTYYNQIHFYEDSTPPQWAEWLAASGANYVPGTSNDGVLNVTQTGAPLEVHTDPTFTVKVSVREARITGNPTAGDLPMADSGATLINQPNTSGGNTTAAVYMAPGVAGPGLDARKLWLYWSTNRTFNGQVPPANAPWELAISNLPAPYVLGLPLFPPAFSDFNFALPGSGAGAAAALPQNMATWWTTPTGFIGNGPGGGALGLGNLGILFPQSPNEQAAATVGNFVPPQLPAVQRNVDTLRMVNPSVAQTLNLSTGYGKYDVDGEAYLFWTGFVDKSNNGSGGGTAITRDTRTFYQLLGTTNAANSGAPQGPTFSMLNDPVLVKLSPKPLLVKLPAANGAPQEKFLFLFWHASSGTSTQIYYNVASSTRLGLALNAPFNPANGDIWTTDAALPLPGSLVSESDPYPTYRHVWSSALSEFVDAVDVAFTGVLKNRQKVEVLLARYQINRNASNGALGALTLLPLPTVTQETLTRVGTTNTFASRDAFWGLGTGPNGTLLTTDVAGDIEIDLLQGSTGVSSTLNYQYALNPMTNAFVSSNGKLQVGSVDPASGLVSYNALSLDPGTATPVSGIAGGQISVDVRSGTVSFPQVAPQINDTVLASYTPYVMRLSTSRDETNVIRNTLGTWATDPAFAVRPAANSPGSNAVPVIIMDRGVNSRYQLTAPDLKGNGATTSTELDRMWVLYRKSDPSGSVKSTIYYKAMRLMIKLPRPFQLGSVNPATGQQQLAAAPTVTGLRPVGPYEIDWVRGRIYFTEQDEGNVITVNYRYYDAATGANGPSGNLTYTVAWGDEMSSASSTGDETVPETPLPTDQAVNEGQVAAFKDPWLDKLWIFWTSTRANTTDLYYETIAPQLYPTASNQQ